LFGGFLIQTLTRLSIFILASVCIRSIWACMTRSSLHLNSFATAFFSLGSEMCSTAPTSFQKCLCILSRFFRSSGFACLVIATYAVNSRNINLCQDQKKIEDALLCFNEKTTKVHSTKTLTVFEDYCVTWTLWFAVAASVAKFWVNNAWLLVVNAENGSNCACADSVTRATSKTLIGVDEGFLHFEHYPSCLRGG
jgi:hypothetical protein